jgi:hypothetical protein
MALHPKCQEGRILLATRGRMPVTPSLAWMPHDLSKEELAKRLAAARWHHAMASPATTRLRSASSLALSFASFSSC